MPPREFDAAAAARPLSRERSPSASGPAALELEAAPLAPPAKRERKWRALWPEVTPTKPAGARLDSLGCARFVASCHIVCMHFSDPPEECLQGNRWKDAECEWPDGLPTGRYVALWLFRVSRWGNTWTPFFFLLSGFVLTYSRLMRRSPARPEGLRSFVRARLVAVYPLHVFALVLLLGAKSTPNVGMWYSFLPTLVLLQAWSWAEACEDRVEVCVTGWNGPSWFLSCLAAYWVLWTFLHPMIRTASPRGIAISCAACYAWSFVWPLAFGAWHGDELPPDDAWYTTMSKYHPITFWHIFVFGMLTGRLFVDHCTAPSSDADCGWPRHVRADVPAALKFGATGSYLALCLLFGLWYPMNPLFPRGAWAESGIRSAAWASADATRACDAAPPPDEGLDPVVHPGFAASLAACHGVCAALRGGRAPCGGLPGPSGLDVAAETGANATCGAVVWTDWNHGDGVGWCVLLSTACGAEWLDGAADRCWALATPFDAGLANASVPLGSSRATIERCQTDCRLSLDCEALEWNDFGSTLSPGLCDLYSSKSMNERCPSMSNATSVSYTRAPTATAWLRQPLYTAARNGLLTPVHALIVASLACGHDPLSRLFSRRPFCWGENVSYSQYILQFPVYFMTRRWLRAYPVLLHAQAILTVYPVLLPAATLTWWFVDRPYRAWMAVPK